MSTIFFFYFAFVLVVAAVLVITLRNPVYSALALLVMFFHVAGLYVTLQAEFLAAVQVIVYAGAILVLYLFVVMLLNVKREDRYHPQLAVGGLIGLTILAEVTVLVVQRWMVPPSIPAGGQAGVGPFGSAESIGDVLYTVYLFPFEIASLILLVAMIGAIVLAKRDLLPGH